MIEKTSSYPRAHQEYTSYDHDSAEVAHHASVALEVDGSSVAFVDKARNDLDQIKRFAKGGEVDSIVGDFVHQANKTEGVEAEEADLIGLENMDSSNHGATAVSLHEAAVKNPDEFHDAAIKFSEVEGAKVLKKTLAAIDEVYFHGSNYQFKIGDIITPGDGAIRGKDGRLNASATTDERTAWAYALDKENLPTGFVDPKSKKNLRGRVYEVLPSDDKPVERLGPQSGEVNSPSFTVVGYRDVQPGRQGTIPDINWKEHYPYVDANHITEDPLFIPTFERKDTYEPSLIDEPLPGLGDDYVKSELERMRRESNRPLT